MPVEPMEPEAVTTPVGDAVPANRAVGVPDAGTTDVGSELVQINGIGPKVANILVEGGIASLAQLADADTDQLRAILVAAGPRYRGMDPSSWPEQAARLLPST
jgi:predicted flap endonuclease-1-like 5' DNA nuclease